MGGPGLVFAIVCLLLAGLPAPGAAQESAEDGLDRVLEQGAVELAADFLEYERSRGLYTARGNVVLEQGGRTIRADWVSFNEHTGVGVASGNVVVEEGGNVLRSSFIEFDVYSVRGVVRDGVFDSSTNHFKARGKVIEKVAADTYRFEQGIFTTCRCPDDDDTEPWRVVADEAELEVGGYAVVRNTTLQVLDVPVLWLPWMAYPVRTERTSGLLLPQAEYSNRLGGFVEQPLFLALHDQVNLTLTPGYSTKRGGRGRAEVEYVFGERSWGDVTGIYAHDLTLDRGERQYEDPFSRDRWALEASQDFWLPAGLRFRSRVDRISDNQVPLDFPEFEGRQAERRLVSRGWAGRSFGGAGRFGALADTRIADDMQSPDDRDRDDTLLQRFIGGKASVLPSGLPLVSGIVTSMDADYAYFDQERDRSNLFADYLGSAGNFLDVGVDGVPNELERGPGPNGAPSRDPSTSSDPRRDPGNAAFNEFTEGDNRFQEGELLIDRGHRLVVHPRVALPFTLGSALEVYPEVGWHQTLYDTEIFDFEERGFLTGRLDARTRLRGRIGSWSHVIEPSAGWALALVNSQDRNPLFVPRTAVTQQRVRALDLDNVVRDDADRIPRANVATLGVTNRFLSADRRHGFDVTVVGLYDAIEGKVNQLALDASLRNRWGFRGRFQLGYDPARGQVDEGLAGLGWRHRSGFEVNAHYRFLRDIPETFEDFPYGNRWDDEERFDEIQQIRGAARVPLTRQWSVAYRGAYSFERDEILSSAASVEYLSLCDCWSAGLEFSGDIVTGVGVKVLYSVEGFGFTNLPGEDGILDDF